MLRRSSNLENWIKGDVKTWKKKRTIIKKNKKKKKQGTSHVKYRPISI